MHVVTRFAPSPTGFMHIGGARTALFAYLWAQKNKGTFILRIEDTDQERSVPGSVAHIKETLGWLGIRWEYGPDTPGPFGSCTQSERLQTYRDAAERLIAAGHAYPDPYSAEEVDAFRKIAQSEKRPFLFRDHRPQNPGVWDGTRPLRFKVPNVRRMHWHDAVRGDLEAGEEALDDFILIKADGYPTYNFAHIIDDHAMGVTHIMRADEFISSTPRFLSLYEALGITPPIFVTLPPILREDRTKKLGKRDGAKDMLEYRTEGYLPEALVNFLALTGWNPGTEQEIFTIDELIAAFTLDGIQSAGAVLNEEKLLWFNRMHMHRLPESEQVRIVTEKVLSHFPGATIDMTTLTRLLLERAHTWGDVDTMLTRGDWEYLFAPPQVPASLLLWKEATPEATHARLLKVHDILNQTPTEAYQTSETLKEILWEYAEKEGRGFVLWPLRTALTGKEKSPDPFVVASLLGKNETLTRVARALETVY